MEEQNVKEELLKIKDFHCKLHKIAPLVKDCEKCQYGISGSNNRSCAITVVIESLN